MTSRLVGVATLPRHLSKLRRQCDATVLTLGAVPRARSGNGMGCGIDDG
jgi:hypothetical protein